MVKFGNPPYLECSSKGDTRLSAFYACPSSLGGQCIEKAYQGMKVLSDGRTGLHWREAKGQRAVNAKECAEAYEKWWREYIEENNLYSVLTQATGLSDMFGQPGGVCQAEVLWKIRMEHLSIIQ